MCVIDLYSKYAWVEPLDSKSAEDVRDTFKEIFSGQRVPQKIWVDRGKEFYNKKMETLLNITGKSKRGKPIELYSTFNEGKSVVAERFIRTLKDKLYRKMTEKGTREYMLYLDAIVFDYNNTVHSTTKMKPVDVRDNSLRSLYEPEPNLKKPKFEVGDTVRMSKIKNIFEKGYTPNWTQELFTVKERLDTNPWTYTLQDTAGDEMYGTFYEQELQKSKAKISRSNL